MLRKNNSGASLTLTSLKSSLVVKHGLSHTLAIVNSTWLSCLHKNGYECMLLGISISLNSNQIETEGEFVVVKVLSSKHALLPFSINFAAAYRSPMSDQTYMDAVNQTLSTLCHKFSNMPIWIGGDMTLPDIE